MVKIYNSAWTGAREHSANRYEKEMQDSAHLGHKTEDITTHYSQAELQKLIDAVAKITEDNLRTHLAKACLQAIKKTAKMRPFLFW